jgi:hypothetical protein
MEFAEAFVFCYPEADQPCFEFVKRGGAFADFDQDFALGERVEG